jgi:hypothetical protein
VELGALNLHPAEYWGTHLGYAGYGQTSLSLLDNVVHPSFDSDLNPKLLHAIGRKYLIRLMKGQIWGDRYWLQLCRNVEELEGARLGRGEIGIEHEGGVGLFGKAHGVAGEGGELGEE